MATSQNRGGQPGADGKTVRNGSGAPSNGLGVDGDFYIDTVAYNIYGPKTAGAWGSPTSLVGADGVDGMDGIDGLGVPAGGTTGQLLAKVSDNDNDTAWIDPPVATGNANRLALFNAGGELTDLAAYQYNPSRFNGMDWSIGVVPGATPNYLNLHNLFASFNPTVNNSQENWRHLFIESAVGTDASGNQLGDLTDGSIKTLVLSTTSRSKSSLGQVGVLETFIDVGHDDPSPVAVTTSYINLLNGQVRWRDNVNVRGIQLINLNFFSGTNSSVVSGNVGCFNFNGNIEEITTGNGFQGGQIAVNIAKTGYFEGIKLSCDVDEIDGGVNGFADFSQYGIMGGGYFGAAIQPNILECDGFFGVNVNPNIDLCNYAYGVNADLSNVDVFAGVKASLVKQDLTYECDQATVDGNNITIEYTSGGTAGSEVVNVAGFNISVQIESGVSTAQQIKDAIDAVLAASILVNITVSGVASNPQTASAAQNLSGGVNPGFKRAGYFKGDVQIDGALSFNGGLSVGTLNAFGPYTIVNGSGSPASTHLLITNPSLAANQTRTGADYLGVNTAMLLQVGDNSTITTGFLGMTALGLPAVVTLGSGASVDRIGGAAFAISLDAAATGGNIGIVALCRSLAIPNGVTTVDRLYGYEFDLPFGDPATDSWGLYCKAGTYNWLQGNLRVGGAPNTDDTTPHRLHIEGDSFFDGSIGFFGTTPAAQQVGAPQTAGGTYTATEQDMIQKAYDCLRTFGLLA